MRRWEGIKEKKESDEKEEGRNREKSMIIK